MDTASLSPFSFFAGLAVGVVLTLMLKRGGASESVPAEPLPPLTGDLETDVRPLIERGRKIEAIKLVRQHTGCGLKEAKEQVEELERRLKG